MADIVRASDVEEAVSIAMRLREEGRYDWFRGQVRNYRVVASLHRIAGAGKEAAIEKIGRFESWVHRTPGLEGLAADGVDAITAVAQHYGLPTPFVDFTTEPEVAGFFACDAADLDPRETSCIICLDTRDLLRFWAAMPPRFPPPECLTVDVSNLWRLQAQHGVFLFCPYGNIEDAYDFDRILFPAAHPADDAARSRMYPPRKSQLEILLDQYFLNERLIEGDRNIKASNWDIVTVNVDAIAPDGIDPDAIDPAIPVLPSWDETTLSRWRSTYDERLADVQRGEVIRLTIDPDADPGVIAAHVRAEVAARLASGDASRAALVDWRVDLGSGTEDLARVLEAALDWLWDGLRTLPHSDNDLATGMGNCAGIGLAHERYSRRYAWNEWTSATEAVLGPAVEVSLGAGDGSYAYCCAASESVLACVRSDIDDYLRPAFRDDLTGNAMGMLQVLSLPDRLFEFDRLARLMARELSPTQVLMRPGRPAYFSPARVKRMGLP